MGGLGSLVEDVEVARVGIEASVFSASTLGYDAEGLERGEHFLCGVEGHACICGDSGGGSDRMALEMVHEAQGGAGEASEAAYLLLVPLKECEEAPGGSCCLGRDCDDAFQEELDPFLPVALGAYGLEQFVVTAAVLFEIQGEIEQGLAEEPFSVQEEGDEQPPGAAIAIQKRVDGLELHMCEGCANEHGSGDGLAVEEVLQGPHALDDGIWWRRDVAYVAGAGAADPVLAATEFAWMLVRAAAIAQEGAMHFTDEAKRKGEALAEQLNAVFQGSCAVGDFPNVVHWDSGTAFGFVQQEVREGGLGSLDLRGKHSFFPNVGVEHVMWLRQEGGDAVESAKSQGGLLCEILEPVIHIQRRLGWQRGWDEGAAGLSQG